MGVGLTYFNSWPPLGCQLNLNWHFSLAVRGLNWFEPGSELNHSNFRLTDPPYKKAILERNRCSNWRVEILGTITLYGNHSRSEWERNGTSRSRYYLLQTGHSLLCLPFAEICQKRDETRGRGEYSQVVSLVLDYCCYSAREIFTISVSTVFMHPCTYTPAL